VEAKRSICFHELNHKLLAARRRPTPLYVFLPLDGDKDLKLTCLKIVFFFGHAVFTSLIENIF
jgi:hypothetical protein